MQYLLFVRSLIQEQKHRYPGCPTVNMNLFCGFGFPNRQMSVAGQFVA